MNRLKNIPKTARQQGLMQGVALKPDVEKQVTLANWQAPPYNRWGFQHVSDLMATARVSRGTGCPVPLPRASSYLGDIICKDPQGKDTTVSQMLQATYTDAFLVMHKGKLVSENYFNGMQADSHHLMMSCTKSYVGSMAGIFVEQGLLDPEVPITDYVPEFEETGFAGATLRECLDMTCGVKYSEAYDEPNSEVRQFEIANGMAVVPECYSGPIGQTEAMLALKETQFAHGEKYCYRSCITLSVAMAIEQVTGRRFHDLLSEYIWQPLGCEWDGSIIIDQDNFSVSEGGLNAAARDWLRFGQMMAQGGSFNGKQIIPESWVQDCRFGDENSRAAYRLSKYPEFLDNLLPNAMYRNQWWTIDAERGVMAALGIHGQTLFIDPVNEVVIAKYSTFPEPEDIDLFVSHLSGMLAISEHLGK